MSKNSVTAVCIGMHLKEAFPDPSLSPVDQRRLTLSRIRRIFIPELVIRLHALLVNTGDKIEG